MITSSIEEFQIKSPWYTSFSSDDFMSHFGSDNDTNLLSLQLLQDDGLNISNDGIHVVFKTTVEMFSAQTSNNTTQEPTLGMPALISEESSPFDPYNPTKNHSEYQLEVNGIGIEHIEKVTLLDNPSEELTNFLDENHISYEVIGESTGLESSKGTEIFKSLITNVLQCYDKYKEDIYTYLQLPSNDFSFSLLLSMANNGELFTGKLRGKLNMSMGVWENTLLGIHTEAGGRTLEMGWDTFRKSFGEKYGIHVFRVIQLLHDIGKGDAFIKDGHTRHQHNTTLKIIDNLKDDILSIGFSEDDFQLIRAVIGNDFLGKYLVDSELRSSNKGTQESAFNKHVEKINNLAKELTISGQELFDATYILYKCDISCYSPHGGGYESRGGNKRSLSGILDDGGFQDDGQLYLKGGKDGGRESSLTKLREALAK